MSDPLKGVLAVAALALAVASGGLARGRSAPAAEPAGAPALTPALRAAPLRFAPGVAPLDQRAVLDAVASARPEARRLIEAVDGLTTVSVAATGAGSVGEARTVPGGYAVTLDLGGVSASLGVRGIRRLVLHELAHVVDFALVGDELMRTLDAGVPRGWECEGGVTGACAAPEERFAESFAKWAMSDIGVDLYIGYKIPPPGPTLEAWGAPLTRLGA